MKHIIQTTALAAALFGAPCIALAADITLSVNGLCDVLELTNGSNATVYGRQTSTSGECAAAERDYLVSGRFSGNSGVIYTGVNGSSGSFTTLILNSNQTVTAYTQTGSGAPQPDARWNGRTWRFGTAPAQGGQIGGSGNLRFNINWGANTNDLDWAVFDPAGYGYGFTCSSMNRASKGCSSGGQTSASTGSWDHDDTGGADSTGLGHQENVFWTAPPDGIYSIYLNTFSFRTTEAYPATLHVTSLGNVQDFPITMPASPNRSLSFYFKVTVANGAVTKVEQVTQ